MKINNSEDFIDLVTMIPELIDFANINVLMGLRAVLNKGCKCNKKKKQAQLECVYSKAINKYTNNDEFKDLISGYMKKREIKDIYFLVNSEVIASIKV